MIAANGGISASIDRAGRIRDRLGKQAADFLLADIAPGHMSSWYVRFGDWFAGLCLACCIFFGIVEWRARRRALSPPPGGPASLPLTPDLPPLDSCPAMPVVLQLIDAHKRYGDQALLDGASCALADDQKVGLIGRNGAGKSTVCRVLLGEEELDAGEVVRGRQLRLGYLRQHDPFNPAKRFAIS